MAQSITLATATENNTCHRNALAQNIAAKKNIKANGIILFICTTFVAIPRTIVQIPEDYFKSG